MNRGFLLMLLKYNRVVIYLIFFILSTVPFFLKLTTNNHFKFNEKELFEEKWTSLRSVNDIIKYVDSICGTNLNSSKLDTLMFTEELSRIIKLRFKHGLTNYSISDNWIAYLSGKLIWPHFSAIVDPNDILKYNEGLCSQQTIVFLEVLKKRGIMARSVGLGFKEGPGHFLSEVQYNKGWHLYDVSLEPNWVGVTEPHRSMDYYIHNKDSLYCGYKYRMSIGMFNKLMSTVNYGETDKFPAKKMLVFHHITHFITVLLPWLFLVLTISSLYKKRKLKRVNL